jgi:putative sterol carrier protein
MASLADRDAAKGVSATYQYLVGDLAFHFIVDDGSLQVRDGRAPDPAVVMATDEQTWADIASGKLTSSSAAAKGALTITGNRQAAKRLGKILSRTQMLKRASAPADAGA